MVGLVVTLWRRLKRWRLFALGARGRTDRDGDRHPVLLLLVFGIVDFGFMFQRYVVLTNAAAEGARVASLPGYTAADAQARVQHMWPMPCRRPVVRDGSRRRPCRCRGPAAAPGPACR